MATPPGISVGTPQGTLEDDVPLPSPSNISAGVVNNRHQQVTYNHVQTWNLPFVRFQSIFDIKGGLLLREMMMSFNTDLELVLRSLMGQDTGKAYRFPSPALDESFSNSFSPMSENFISHPPSTRVQRFPRIMTSTYGCLVSFCGGVFQRYPDELQIRMTRLASPNNLDAVHEFLCFVFQLTSNNAEIGLNEEQDLLAWISMQSDTFLKRLFDQENLTIQASLEWLVCKALQHRNGSVGSALLRADTRSKLFSGHSAKRLQAAAVFGDLGLVRALLDDGCSDCVNVNEQLGTADHPESILASASNVEVARALLDANANIDAPSCTPSFGLESYSDKMALSPLQLAMRSSNDNLVRLFLRSGAIFDPETILNEAISNQKRGKPLILPVILEEASTMMAWTGEHTRICIKEKDLALAALSDYASAHQLNSLLKISTGAELVGNLRTRARLLASASTKEFPGDVLTLLVKLGANVNLPGKLHTIAKNRISEVYNKHNLLYGTFSRSNHGTNPADVYAALLAAVESNSLRAVKFLVAHHADVNAQVSGRLGSTVLEAAMKLNLPEIAQFLVNSGATVNSQQLIELQNFALAQAVREKDSCRVRILIKESANPAYMLDGIIDGIASRTQRSEMLKLFIRVCEDINARLPQLGYSVLECAIIIEDLDIAQFLVNAGATVDDSTVGFAVEYFWERRSYGWTQFTRLLLSKGIFDCERFLKRAISQMGNAVDGDRTLELVKLLVESGLDINPDYPQSYPETQRSPLGHAVDKVAVVTELRGVGEDEMKHALELVAFLLSAGAYVDGFPTMVTNEDGLSVKIFKSSTPLQRAAGDTCINMRLIQMLLDAGADINAPPRAENGHLDTVQLLLDAGAEGLEHAAELAERQRHYVIARLLRTENEKRWTSV